MRAQSTAIALQVCYRAANLLFEQRKVVIGMQILLLQLRRISHCSIIDTRVKIYNHITSHGGSAAAHLLQACLVCQISSRILIEQETPHNAGAGSIGQHGTELHLVRLHKGRLPHHYFAGHSTPTALPAASKSQQHQQQKI